MAPKRQRTGQEGASSSTPRPVNLDVQFGSRNTHMKERFEKLRKRQIISTKFACLETLSRFNMIDGVTTLLSKGGLVDILNRSASTFQRPTYEFLASLERATKENERAISFRLMGRTFLMSYTEVATAFGWVVGGVNWNAPTDLETSAFWVNLTGIQYQGRGGNKVNSIVHPCFRFAYKLLNDSLFLNGEVGAVSLFGIKHFWALCPEGAGTPPWVEIFVTGCLQEQNKDKGKITFGGMVTLLANALGVEFSGACLRLPGGFRYDLHSLRQAQFLEFTTGPFQMTRYLIKGQAPLPIPPDPTNLFDIPDGISTDRLRTQVLQRLVVNVESEDDDDGDDDENEEEDENEEGDGQAPHQEASRGGNYESWRPYIDARLLDLENRMGARIDRYHSEVRDLRNDFQQFRSTLDQRWGTEDQRWGDIMEQLQRLQTRDPVHDASLEARRQEEWQRHSRGYPGAGPGSSES